MTTVDVVELGVIGVVDAVTRQLRTRILAGELAAGTLVTEAKVSAMFAVARPSAKAAIEQLVGSGMLTRTAHRSARVVQITAEMVRDVYRTRVRLESAALRELAASGSVPEAAVMANAELLAMPSGPDAATVDPDMRFHASLIDAIGSERTSRMYGSLIDEVRLCMAQVQGRRLLAAEVISEQHAAILDAVRLRDGSRAAELLTAHLASAERRLTDALGDEQACFPR